MMAMKLILEGARSFKAAPKSDPAEPANDAVEHGSRRWPSWPRAASARKESYLIGIRPRPRHLPRV